MSVKVLRIYLDGCSLQRPFDDQRQARIRLEAEAIKILIARAENGELEWLTSEVVDYEVAQTLTPNARLKQSYLRPTLEPGSWWAQMKSRAQINSNNLASRASMLCTWRAPKVDLRTCFSPQMINC